MSAWRRWRFTVTLAGLVLLGGIVIALITTPRGTTGYLDPGNPGAAGARAAAAILAQRGHRVVRVTTVPAAAAAARGGHPTLVITNPGRLTPGELAALARVPGDRLLVAPGAAALAALAPGVARAGASPSGPASPGCALPAAALAGSADAGGTLLATTRPGALRCYRRAGRPSLVRYASGGQITTVLGSGAPLSNGDLASLGNAALVLNLLDDRPEIIWLVPEPPPAAASRGQTPLAGLIPLPAYLVVIQLALAAAACALWRTRRLGPLVAERLPAVVRATETVEGHGRLYRSRRSRDRAAATLREAARARLAARLGLPENSPPAAVAAVASGRTGGDPQQAAAVLFGAVPDDDAGLVRLADALDALERKVHTW